MAFLLDTNVWIDLSRGNYPQVEKKFLEVDKQLLRVSTIVLGELVLGAIRSDNPHTREKFEILTRGISIVDVDTDCAYTYGEIRADLAAQGQMIGANDLWIATQAVSRDLTLVTSNVEEFSRVKNLSIVDWRTGIVT